MVWLGVSPKMFKWLKTLPKQCNESSLTETLFLFSIWYLLVTLQHHWAIEARIRRRDGKDKIPYKPKKLFVEFYRIALWTLNLGISQLYSIIRRSSRQRNVFFVIVCYSFQLHTFFLIRRLKPIMFHLSSRTTICRKANPIEILTFYFFSSHCNRR